MSHIHFSTHSSDDLIALYIASYYYFSLEMCDLPLVIFPTNGHLYIAAYVVIIIVI